LGDHHRGSAARRKRWGKKMLRRNMLAGRCCQEEAPGQREDVARRKRRGKELLRRNVLRPEILRGGSAGAKRNMLGWNAVRRKYWGGKREEKMLD
jgi:hypothetical protein